MIKNLSKKVNSFFDKFLSIFVFYYCFFLLLLLYDDIMCILQSDYLVYDSKNTQYNFEFKDFYAFLQRRHLSPLSLGNYIN